MFGILKKREKIFCIGFNKTGTTTLAKVLEDFGYRLADQDQSERLFRYWKERNFKPIIEFCKKADAFQDIPFSLPFTFQVLHFAYPHAKFILTVRDSEEEWYESLYRYHVNLFGDGKTVTEEDLQNAKHIWKGWAFEVNQHRYHPPKGEPYHKETLIKSYKTHNYIVEEYFHDKPDSFIKINVAKKEDYFRLAQFLNKKPLYDDFPWLNRSK
ncbi:MAG: hypothetical protein KatS3mg034_1118 [Vicingaceae bacterium]|nr:MAG: hypothetical protein KatS3mg028_1611 [Bacteroidia bacterium]GIV41808.1 MAG: hypothetical protein KatS3mg034_1118 [Vicingaceae bacterium]